jgi:hypothetical protein
MLLLEYYTYEDRGSSGVCNLSTLLLYRGGVMKILNKFKIVLAASVAVAGLGVAAPAGAVTPNSIVHTVDYLNASSHTISVWTQTGCSGTRKSVLPNHYSGNNYGYQSYKSSYKTHSQVHHYSGTWGPTYYHSANTCVSVIQESDWADLVRVSN